MLPEAQQLIDQLKGGATSNTFKVAYGISSVENSSSPPLCPALSTSQSSAGGNIQVKAFQLR